MAAYIVVGLEITDPEGFARYREMVPATLEAYGGRYLVRGGETETLEGSWDPARFVVIEFDSVDQAKRWWDSDEYREARDLRQATTSTQMIVVQGV